MLIAMINNPSKNISDEFTKRNEIGPSVESLNIDFFQFSGKVIKSFVLSSWLRIRL